MQGVVVLSNACVRFGRLSRTLICCAWHTCQNTKSVCLKAVDALFVNGNPLSPKPAFWPQHRETEVANKFQILRVHFRRCPSLFHHVPLVALPALRAGSIRFLHAVKEGGPWKRKHKQQTSKQTWKSQRGGQQVRGGGDEDSARLDYYTIIYYDMRYYTIIWCNELWTIIIILLLHIILI